MIKTRDDLQDYLDKDKRALGMKKRRPSIIGDEIWKFEIALRMDEFYRNTQKNKLAGLFWKWRHRQLGLKLGFSIPCNCFGGVENKSLWPDCSTSIGKNWRMV